MKTRLKEPFSIEGFSLSMIVSLFLQSSFIYRCTLLSYRPLLFEAACPCFPSLCLYCLLIWFIMGAIFRWSGSFFQETGASCARRQPLWRDDSDLALLSGPTDFFPKRKIISLTLTVSGNSPHLSNHFRRHLLPHLMQHLKNQ